MNELITDEIVAKAVVARGSDATREGVGTVMRRALEAVADDIVDRYLDSIDWIYDERRHR